MKKSVLLFILTLGLAACAGGGGGGGDGGNGNNNNNNYGPMPGTQEHCDIYGSASCTPGNSEYCVINGWNSCTPGHSEFCAVNATDESCEPGNWEWCNQNVGADICTPGHPDYCAYGSNSVNNVYCIPGSYAYCSYGPNASTAVCTQGTPEWCGAQTVNYTVCIPGSWAYCALDWNQSSAVCTPGTSEYCSYTDNQIQNICIPGHATYCAYGTNGSTDICTTGTLEWCSYGPNINSNVCKPGHADYCAISANADKNICAPGHSEYCAYNANRNPCKAGTAEYCAYAPNADEAICTPGTPQYCAYGTNGSHVACQRGTPEYCATPGTTCDEPGTLDYCSVTANSSTNICTPGHEDYCAYGTNSTQFICRPGTAAYCAYGDNSTKNVCIPGTSEYCAIYSSSDPICYPGSVEYCAYGSNGFTTVCTPGTEQYCNSPYRITVNDGPCVNLIVSTDHQILPVDATQNTTVDSIDDVSKIMQEPGYKFTSVTKSASGNNVSSVGAQEIPISTTQRTISVELSDSGNYVTLKIPTTTLDAAPSMGTTTELQAQSITVNPHGFIEASFGDDLYAVRASGSGMSPALYTYDFIRSPKLILGGNKIITTMIDGDPIKTKLAYTDFGIFTVELLNGNYVNGGYGSGNNRTLLGTEVTALVIEDAANAGYKISPNSLASLTYTFHGNTVANASRGNTSMDIYGTVVATLNASKLSSSGLILDLSFDNWHDFRISSSIDVNGRMTGGGMSGPLLVAGGYAVDVVPGDYSGSLKSGSFVMYGSDGKPTEAAGTYHILLQGVDVIGAYGAIRGN